MLLLSRLFMVLECIRYVIVFQVATNLQICETLFLKKSSIQPGVEEADRCIYLGRQLLVKLCTICNEPSHKQAKFVQLYC